VNFKKEVTKLLDQLQAASNMATDVDPSAFLKAEKTTADTLMDFKKCVWVPDEQEGFVSASVKEQTGDVATLELSNGSVSARSSFVNFSYYMLLLAIIIYFLNTNLYCNLQRSDSFRNKKKLI